MRLTIRQLFVIILFLGLFLMTLRPIDDPDFWWHLRTGQLIAQTNSIPRVDPFSYTNASKPWVAHEWLSELLIFGLYQLGSYGLLVFAFSLVIASAFFLAYMRSPSESRPYMAGFSLLLGSIATAPAWGVRPQMISLFLTSLLLYLLERYRLEGKLKFIIPLPLIMLGWVNLHAGYFLGLALLLIYIMGSLIDLLKAGFQRTRSSPANDFKPILIICGVLGISILATVVNPNGFNILLYPFQTLTSPAMQQFIQEWFSPDFHQLEWQPLAWFFLALIGAGMFFKKQISTTNILLTLFFGYAALRSMRNVPLFAIVAIPILAEQIDSLVRINPTVRKPNRLMKAIIPILLVCIVLVVGNRFVQVVQGQLISEMDNFPRRAVDWIKENQPDGNLFNSYGWGGYLIWQLFPQYPVYIDGRADVYGDKFLYTYTDIYNARLGWEQALEAHAVRLVLVEPGSGLANALRQSFSWEIYYEDQISVLFNKK